MPYIHRKTAYILYRLFLSYSQVLLMFRLYHESMKTNRLPATALSAPRAFGHCAPLTQQENTMTTIYKETIGPATIELIDNNEMNTSYTVKLTDNAGTRQANVISYEIAIRIYDNTVQQAALLYNVTPAPIGKPDFTATVTR